MQKKINKYISIAVAVTMVSTTIIPTSLTTLQNKSYAAPMYQGEKFTIYDHTYWFEKDSGTITGYENADISTGGSLEQGISLQIPSHIDGVKVKKIGEYAFHHKNIQSVVIPAGVTTIGSGAFAKNYLLTNVVYQGVNPPGHDFDVYMMAHNLNIYAPTKAYIEALHNQWIMPANIKLPEGIEVTSSPQKTKYLVGEEINLTGLMVTATYSDDSKKEIEVTSDNIEEFDSTAQGSKTLTIKVDELTATFDIEVVASMLTNVENAEYSDIKQEDATSEEMIKTALKSTATTAVNDEGVSITINKVEYSEPIAGTSENEEGTNGSYKFTVTVSKGDQEQTTEEKTITLKATSYTNAQSDFEFNEVTGEITKYIGSRKDVVIPSTIDQISVKSIGPNAFAGKELTSVVIPESVTDIKSSAFAYNKLTEFIIPEGVTTIGTSAFASNQLTSVDIPKGVLSIGNSAFIANQLTSVSFLEGLSTIGTSAFMTNKLTNVILPKSLTEIKTNAFRENTGLTSITYKSATAPTHGKTVYGDAKDNLIIYIPHGSSSSYTSETLGYSKVTLEEEKLELNLTSIELTSEPTNKLYVLGEALDLTGLVVTGIDNSVTPALTQEIPITADNITGFDSSQLGKQTLTITVGELTATLEVEVGLDMGGGIIAKIDGTKATLEYIGIGTGKINDYSSNNTDGNGLITPLKDKGIKSVVIGEGIKDIGYYAFYDLGIESLTLPEGLLTIGNYAFQLNKLKELLLPSSVETIGSSAFSQNELESITLSEKLISIGSYSFALNKLISVTYKSEISPAHSQGVFYNEQGSKKPKAYVPIGTEQQYTNTLAGQGITVSTELGRLLDEITISNEIKDNENITMPKFSKEVTATITVDKPKIISSTGLVTPVAEDTEVTITIELTKDGLTESREYKIMVKANKLGVLNKVISSEKLTNTTVKEILDYLFITTTEDELEVIKLNNPELSSNGYGDMDIMGAKLLSYELSNSYQNQDKMPNIEFIHTIEGKSKIATYDRATRELKFKDNKDNKVIKVINKRD